MKQMLVSYMAYELWANERILKTILSLPGEQQHQEVISSFPSLYKTCLHIWDASFIWWQRIQRKEQIVVPSLSFHPTMEEVARELLEQNQEWLTWIGTLSEADMEQVVPYKTIKGDAFAQPLKDILHHLPNHGTYHRGQLVTMLRQLGVTDIAQIDYVLYARTRS